MYHPRGINGISRSRSFGLLSGKMPITSDDIVSCYHLQFSIHLDIVLLIFKLSHKTVSRKKKPRLYKPETHTIASDLKAGKL